MILSKMYISYSELSEMFKKHLSEEDKLKFKEFDFVPINIKFNEHNASLELLFAPTPKEEF